MRRRHIVVLLALALLAASGGCRPHAASFTVRGVPFGQRVALYDASTGERLSISPEAAGGGTVAVPLPADTSLAVFAMCTDGTGKFGTGVASREMTVTDGATFAYASWRDAPRAGKVELYFDDAPASVWKNGRAILREFGMAARIAVVTRSASATAAGTTGAAMSWGQIAEMAQDGHVIVSHTRTHPHLRQLDDRALDSEFAGALSDLRRRGYETSEIVYPFGESDARVVAAAKRYYRRGRGTVGFNDAKTDPFLLATQDTRGGAAVVDEYVDEAINSNRWLTLMYHGVDAERQDESGAYVQSLYDVNPSVLRAELAHIVSSGIAYPVLAGK